MIWLLKKWHWLHSWTSWRVKSRAQVSYPWTGEDFYAHERVVQERNCSVCNKLEIKVIDNV